MFAALQVLPHAIHPPRQLVLRDHLFVDYRDDPVDQLDTRRHGLLLAGALRERRPARSHQQHCKLKSHNFIVAS